MWCRTMPELRLVLSMLRAGIRIAACPHTVMHQALWRLMVKILMLRDSNFL